MLTNDILLLYTMVVFYYFMFIILRVYSVVETRYYEIKYNIVLEGDYLLIYF